jgi:hypothetical protein
MYKFKLNFLAKNRIRLHTIWVIFSETHLVTLSQIYVFAAHDADKVRLKAFSYFLN